jgi:predicted permease
VGREWVRLGYVQTESGRLDRDAIPVNDLLTGSVRPALFILFAAVTCILLIACANVTNLLLARADARRAEVATQVALGATRSRIAREHLVESALLALPSAALGVGIGFACVRATIALTPLNVLRVRDIGIDAPIVAFSVLITSATTVLAFLAPTLDLLRINLAQSLAAGGRSLGSTVRKRLRYALVGAQTALSVILLIAAGLLARSFVQMRRIDVGFQSERVLTFRVGLPAASYPSPQPAVRFYRDLLERLRALPGVQHAGAARVLPLTNTIGDWTITIENRPLPPESNPNGDWQIVTPGYFETMGVTLLRGRFITAADHENAPLVALVDRNMAEKYWPGDDALGKRFHLGDADQPWITIVGITRPVHHNAVVEEPRTEMFVPHAQWARATALDFAPLGMTIVLKTSGNPLAQAAAARAAVRALDPSLPVAEVRTMAEVTARALAQPRFVAFMLAAFAGLALALAALGLYGVITFLVSRRTQEIGIRMALGATQRAIVRQVLGEGVALAALGVTGGLIGAFWLTRFLSGQLYGVQRLDPLTFVVVPAVLLLVAVSATWLPARRAAAGSPLTALRRG